MNFLYVVLNYILWNDAMKPQNTFLYFAYGSNLLTSRIHINNPSAIRMGIGELENYRLDFITFSQRWKGASATIVPTNGSSVWGSLWQINNEHMASLDCQEGVADKIYFPLTVDVKMPNGTTVSSRVYEQTVQPDSFIALDNLPEDRRPSAIYMKTIIEGAIESGIPEHYVNFLKTVRDNGYSGSPELNLELKFNKPS